MGLDLRKSRMMNMQLDRGIVNQWQPRRRVRVMVKYIDDSEDYMKKVMNRAL